MFKNFLPENHGFYEIMKKNTVEPDEPLVGDKTYNTACVRFAFWITKTTNTHSG